jgi:ABC-type Fe3+ transport system permease subunit
MDKRILIYIIISIIVLAVFIGLIFWNISNNKKHPITEDQKSKDRMEDLNNIFTSILGDKWPYLLFIFCIILIVFFYMLFIMSIKGVSINIDENNHKLFSTIFIIFLILFGIAIIILTVMAVQNRKYDDKYCISNYKPADDTASSNSQTLQIVGLSLFILASLIGVLYYFLRKRTNSSNNVADLNKIVI